MNIQALMSQAQNMQKKMQKKLEEFEKKHFEYDYKNGSIIIVIRGDYTIMSTKINKVLIDPTDPEMLQDMITEATNAAISGIRQDREEIEGSVIPK